MATKAQILTNPETGEYFEFVETATETGGACTTLKVLIKKGGFKPVMHKHLLQDESFEVISGQLTYVLEGQPPKTIGPGEKVTLPKGVGHTHYNDGDVDLLMYQSVSPSLDFEPFVEALHHHMLQGSLKEGQPPFLQLMVWMKEMEGKTCVASIPLGIQFFLASILAPLGKWMGYRAFYS
jgi:quercetin dioxygenase-like cupin family protein